VKVSPADGVLLVDKPTGVTSHDMVAAARRALGEKRIGHAGTLDPFATGLLVLLVGRATRLLPYIDGDPKVYEATVRFGAETTTEDLLGEVTVTAASPTFDAVRDAVGSLTGELDQMPPAYSAKRVDGRRAYDIARAGEVPDLKSARVRVDSWELLNWRAGESEAGAAELDVRITCGGGTYIRSLARDLGRLTGSAAHLCALRRVRSGAFRVTEATSLEALRAGEARLLPPLAALPHTPVELLSAAEVARVVRGIEVPATVAGDRAALVHEDSDALVALAERRGASWQPRVVMREAP
jgi:tRNA pseudouridine55 synthase